MRPVRDTAVFETRPKEKYRVGSKDDHHSTSERRSSNYLRGTPTFGGRGRSLDDSFIAEVEVERANKMVAFEIKARRSAQISAGSRS